MCSRCATKPVYVTQNHRSLCKKCFLDYVERKVLRTVRTYKLLEKNDKLCVGISGGKDSLTCLSILHQYFRDRVGEIFALAIDEGIEQYREITLKDARAFCRSQDIPLKVVSYREMFGTSLPAFIKKTGMKPCTPCGIMRRYLLNRGSRKLGATKLATGHNMDDECQTIVMNMLKGNMGLSAKLGPKTGVLVHDKFVPRIKPLYFVSEKETTLYSKLKELPVTYAVCPNSFGAFRLEVGKMLNGLEAKYPGTKNGIVNSFLQILPMLHAQFQGERIGTCTRCSEPANHALCKLCELLGERTAS